MSPEVLQFLATYNVKNVPHTFPIQALTRSFIFHSNLKKWAPGRPLPSENYRNQHFLAK